MPATYEVSMNTADTTTTKDKEMQASFSYLDRQFSGVDAYLDDIKALVQRGDFTLGAAVSEFESRFATSCGLPYAVGVNSGTDALILSLRILGVGSGDEVITTPNTFIATVGAIAMTGARPVFVDCNSEYMLDVSQIEAAITHRTKAIVPVHWTGYPADMPAIMDIAQHHDLFVIEDAAQGIQASIYGKHVGSWGETACFSLHPLKNLNVWGDAGVIVTRSAELYNKLRLYRNHGMASRDEIEMFGYNSRLDTLQAVIANRLLSDVCVITEQRISNATLYDEAFVDLDGYITIPLRRSGYRHVYHLYIVQAHDRDALLDYLQSNGIRAKIHYPIPLHLQKAAAYLGYKTGDFPVCEELCRTTITLPVHQHLTDAELAHVIEHVRKFYLAQ